MACTKENLVFDDGKLPLIKTNADRLKLLIETSVKGFNAGFERAKNFLKGANFYHENKELAITAFMLQQATELTFRTVILSLTGSDVKTHSIRILKKHCTRCAPASNKVFPGDNENEERIINLLDKAYLHARYYPDFTITDSELILPFNRVKLLQVKAMNVFEDRNRFEQCMRNDSLPLPA